MLKNIELKIFDFDGVLVDTKQAILFTFQKSFEEKGYNYSIEEIERYNGQNLPFI